MGTAALIGGAFEATAAVTFALYQLFARELILRRGQSLFTAVAMSAAGVMALLGFFLTHPAAALVPPRGAWTLILALAVFSGITRFPGTTGLSATPPRPCHPSRASGCSSLST